MSIVPPRLEGYRGERRCRIHLAFADEKTSARAPKAHTERCISMRTLFREQTIRGTLPDGAYEIATVVLRDARWGWRYVRGLGAMGLGYGEGESTILGDVLRDKASGSKQ